MQLSCRLQGMRYKTMFGGDRRDKDAVQMLRARSI
jgi:hypothetical protein